MEKWGYALLGIGAAFWLGAVITGMISALPWGALGLFFILGLGLLFMKVLKDRLGSKEDEYYSKNIDQ